MKCLKVINSQEKTEDPTTTDIYNFLSLAMRDDDDLDDMLAKGTHAGASLYVMCMQTRVVRALMRNINSYAQNLQSDDPECLEFKNLKTPASLQSMLIKQLCPEPNQNPQARSASRRNLLDQLVQPGQQAQAGPSENEAGRSQDGADNSRS